MTLGKVVNFLEGSYEIRGVVDDRFVVRIRNRKTGKQAYKIWTEDERAAFDRQQGEVADRRDRDRQIYERRLTGETYQNLAREFGVSATTIAQICSRQARKEKSASRTERGV